MSMATILLVASRGAVLRRVPLAAPQLSKIRGGNAKIRGGAACMSVASTAGVPLSAVSISKSECKALQWEGDLIILPFWQPANDGMPELSAEMTALDVRLDGTIAALIDVNEFKGTAGSSATTLLPRTSAIKKLAVVGLGKVADFKSSGAKKWGEFIASCAKAEKAKTAAVVLPAFGEAPLDVTMQQAAYEAMLLGLSPDIRYKSDTTSDEVKPPPLAEVHVLDADQDAITRARHIASGVLLTRGLVGSPANYATPTALALAAEAIASEFTTMSLKVLERDECEALGMGAYLGVSQGAAEPPKFIHLTYKPAGAPSKKVKKVAIIGKGLTFDSGGYNIKAGAGSMIEKMKFDMGGAGAVLGAARVVGDTAPEHVEAHFIIAACENMVSERAMRPGDILTASNNKTIEVINTDAEGRLTLADALVYAEKLGELDAVVDIATLTGACIIALGNDYGGLWSSSDELASQLQASAKATGELLWHMPLAAEYKEQVKSTIADLKNVGERGGGSITAALFLQEFVKETPWAHMDIAGPVWNDKAGGATGYAVRTLSHFVCSE